MFRIVLLIAVIFCSSTAVSAQIVVNLIDGFTLEPLKDHSTPPDKNNPLGIEKISASSFIIKKPIEGTVISINSDGYFSKNLELSAASKETVNVLIQPGDSLLSAYKSKYDFYQSTGSKKNESEPMQTIPTPASAKSVVTFPEEQNPSGNPVEVVAPKSDPDFMSDPEIPAEFPGGQIELRKFIMTHLRYPQRAVDLGIQGKVFVRFLVSKNGEISNICVVRGGNLLLDTECVRIIKLMPNWNPGMLDGKAMNTTFAMPIQFKLQ